ncbi:MAG: DNA polymerase Y family protein [Alphaproteobacteria bacterium]|nr:DNA polymerase Y family protein [Alphaproteobacteria bacterium]
MRRIISLWLPSWPIDRWRQRRAAPADGPFALVATVDGGRRLAALDAAAVAAGLRVGDALADARARLPALVTADAEPERDAADLLALARWCQRYTPWTRPDEPAGVLLDVTGCAALFGGEAGLLGDLAGRLARRGLGHRLAIADTPGAAWAAARYAAGPSPAVIPAGAGRAALAPLPVEALGLDAVAAAGLRRVGLGRIGDLCALPRAPLVARFGAAVATRLDQALGALPEPVMPLAPAPERRVRLAFAEPIATAEPIAEAARRLLDDLCARLAADGTGAVRLALDFYRVDAEMQRLAVGTARPSRDPAHLFRLLAERLPLVEPGFGIELAMLSLLESAPLAPEPAGRLDVVVPAAPAPAAPRRRPPQEDRAGEVLAMAAELAPLVDRIQNRLGYSAVHRPAPRASHVPERAVAALAPFAPDPPAEAAWPARRAPRPLRLLRRPEPVEATAPVPDDPPVLFRWRTVLYRVRRADGPERIAAEWWREEGGVRDYYRVEDEAGRRFWLYRSGLHDGTATPRWFLHGFFA